MKLLALSLVFIIPILGALNLYYSLTHKKKLTTEEALIAREKLNSKKFRYNILQNKFDDTKIFLSTHGVNYMFRKNISPFEYYFACLFFGIFSAFVVMSLNTLTLSSIFLGIIAFIIGAILPRIIIKISNSSDNDEMLPDICIIYNFMKIQAEAGVFASTSLGECYKQVKNPRLKSALKDFKKYMIAKNDIVQALQDFNIKFNNTYIDTLCITLEQSTKTGQSIQMLSDVSDQLQDIEHVLYIKEKDKADSITAMMEFFVFAIILAIVVYATFTEVTGQTKLF